MASRTEEGLSGIGVRVVASLVAQLMPLSLSRVCYSS